MFGSNASGASFRRQIDRRAWSQQWVCVMNMKWDPCKEAVRYIILDFLVKAVHSEWEKHAL